MSSNNKNNKTPRAPYSIRKEQQKLWSWYDFYTRLATFTNREAAEKVKQELKTLEETNPLLPTTNFRW